MRDVGRFPALVGKWKGVKRLWLTPDTPVKESESAASVELVAQGKYATIRYTWAEEGRPQDGLLLVRLAEELGKTDVVWVDSYHTGDAPMTFEGDAAGKGLLAVKGTWGPPDGPAWGWRIEFHSETDDALGLTMYVVTPDGREALAVQADFARA